MQRGDSLGRRRSERIKVTYMVSYRFELAGIGFGQYDHALTNDISRGGMRIVIDRNLAKGTKIDMTIQLPMYPDRKINVQGVIVSSKQTAERKSYYKIGIKFDNFDMKYFKTLGEFVKEEMKKAGKNGVTLRQKLDRRKK